MLLKEKYILNQKENSPGPVVHDESLQDGEDQVCGICGMDYEDHAEDFNVQLMHYNQLL